LIANHGHHPEPPKYGITAEGKDWRPGDYYRRIPELFVAQGFMVVMPDFRGHNNSDGFEFTEGMLESSYYSEDVLSLLAALDGLADEDLAKELYMRGHKYEFHSYPGSDHLFKDEMMEQAAERDIGATCE
jgi:hypothetical protein